MASDALRMMNKDPNGSTSSLLEAVDHTPEADRRVRAHVASASQEAASIVVQQAREGDPDRRDDAGDDPSYDLSGGDADDVERLPPVGDAGPPPGTSTTALRAASPDARASTARASTRGMESQGKVSPRRRRRRRSPRGARGGRSPRLRPQPPSTQLLRPGTSSTFRPVPTVPRLPRAVREPEAPGPGAYSPTSLSPRSHGTPFGTARTRGAFFSSSSRPWQDARYFETVSPGPRYAKPPAMLSRRESELKASPRPSFGRAPRFGAKNSLLADDNGREVHVPKDDDTTPGPGAHDPRWDAKEEAVRTRHAAVRIGTATRDGARKTFISEQFVRSDIRPAEGAPGPGEYETRGHIGAERRRWAREPRGAGARARRFGKVEERSPGPGRASLADYGGIFESVRNAVKLKNSQVRSGFGLQKRGVDHSRGGSEGIGPGAYEPRESSLGWQSQSRVRTAPMFGFGTSSRIDLRQR